MQNQAHCDKSEIIPPTGRFAPSPSGRLHLGNLACSLLAWLSARSRGGRIVLRIEDLDAERCPRHLCRPAGTGSGLAGPCRGTRAAAPAGRTAPITRVSARRSTPPATGSWRSSGLVYPCFCSRAQLHAASAPHTSDGNVVYPGTCRGLTAAEIAGKTQKESPGLPPDGAGRGHHIRGRLHGPAHREPAARLRRFLPAPGRRRVRLSAGRGGGRCPHGRHRSGARCQTCCPPRHGSYTCTACWACRHRGLPTARCCWPRMGGGSPSATATRVWKTCGKSTPRRRSWASLPTPTACSRSLRPARRKA